MSKLRRAGFTIIELLVVMVVIGLLAAIAAPKFTGTKQKGTRATGISDLRNLATAQESYFSDNGVYGAVTDTAALRFSLSKANTGLTIALTGTPAGTTGWNASITIPGSQKCGIFSGTAPRPTGMPVTAPDGVPVCW